MGSDGKRLFGAVGRDDVPLFDPEDLRMAPRGHVLYDPRGDPGLVPLQEEMVQSIMEHGVTQTVTLTKDGLRPHGTPNMLVVDGRRRVLHCREANRRLTAVGKQPWRIRARVLRGTDQELYGVMITLNEIRTVETPSQRARKIQQGLERGVSLETMTLDFGLSVAKLKELLALLDCAEPVQRAVDEGEIHPRAARTLAKLPKAEQTKKLGALRAEGATGKKATKALADEAAKNKPGRARVRPVAEVRAALNKIRLTTDGPFAARAAVKALEFVLGELSEPEFLKELQAL